MLTFPRISGKRLAKVHSHAWLTLLTNPEANRLSNLSSHDQAIWENFIFLPTTSLCCEHCFSDIIKVYCRLTSVTNCYIAIHMASNITANARVKEFGSANFHSSDGVLFCTPCNKVINHLRRSTITDHLKSLNHEQFYKKRDLLQRRYHLRQALWHFGNPFAADFRTCLPQQWSDFNCLLTAPMSNDHSAVFEM